MASIPAPPVHRIALIQTLIVASLGLLLLFVSKVLALSVLVGGLIQIVPQAYFTQAAYRYTGAAQSVAMLREFYKGESGKVLLTVVMFAMAFITLKNLNYPVVFLSFIAMMIVHGICAAKIISRTVSK